MFGRRILAVAAFVAAVSAQGLTITNPGPNSWWVANSVNTLAWTCGTSSYSEYTVVVSNSNNAVLTSPLALIADVPNYDCSLSVNQQQSALAVSDSWTISFANIQNQSDIYASAQFSVQASGSPYPVSSASGTATSSGASASSTSANKSGAAANYIPVGLSMAAAAFLGLVVA